jgi:hypothetical protein
MPANDTRDPAALPLVDKLLFSAAARGLPLRLGLCPMLPRCLMLLLPEALNALVDSPRICAAQQQTPQIFSTSVGVWKTYMMMLLAHAVQ